MHPSLRRGGLLEVDERVRGRHAGALQRLPDRADLALPRRVPGLGRQDDGGRALMVQTVDVAVLGGGPGGLSAATNLALRGLDVVVVNDGHVMGYGIEGAFK